MENESERFWEYLLEKKERYLEKKEIYMRYKNFLNLWDKEDNFNLVFDNLRKNNKLSFLLDKKWVILTKEESIILRKDKSRYNSLFFIHLFDYFKQENMAAYFGLQSAEYFKGISWQTPHTFYLVNEKYSLKKKVKNQTVIFIKFPKGLFIESAILNKNSFDGKYFSDNEKTLLDKIYYNEYLKGKLNLSIPQDINLEKINLYLGFYKKYPFVRSYLINLLNENQLKKII